MLDSGALAGQIGVVSAYRYQVQTLKRNIQHGIEVLTVDQFQGRDKECVFISFVRSNTSLQPGDLLRDWRRLNVAITRAKTKLVMIGSHKTLSQSVALHNLLAFLDSKGWIISPNADSHILHAFGS